jgi:hypothetical protein
MVTVTVTSWPGVTVNADGRVVDVKVGASKVVPVTVPGFAPTA